MAKSVLFFSVLFLMILAGCEASVREYVPKDGDGIVLVDRELLESHLNSAGTKGTIVAIWQSRDGNSLFVSTTLDGLVENTTVAKICSDGETLLHVPVPHPRLLTTMKIDSVDYDVYGNPETCWIIATRTSARLASAEILNLHSTSPSKAYYKNEFSSEFAPTHIFETRSYLVLYDSRNPWTTGKGLLSHNCQLLKKPASADDAAELVDELRISQVVRSDPNSDRVVLQKVDSQVVYDLSARRAVGRFGNDKFALFAHRDWISGILKTYP